MMGYARFAWLMLIATWFVAPACAHAAGWAPRPGFEVSGSYGTVSRISQDPSFDLLDATYGAGWSAGVTAEWPLAAGWTFVSGLRYLDAGQSQTINFTLSGSGTSITGSVDFRETFHWLAIPMRARVTPWAAPVSLEAGPEVQVLLNARYHSHANGFTQALRVVGDGSSAIHPAPAAQIFEDVGTFGPDGDVTDSYRKVNLVLGGGVGFAWPHSDGHVVLHARCGFGLNDLRKSADVASRTRSVEVGAGWQW